MRAGLVLAAALAAAGAARADDFDARKAPDILSVVTTHGASGELKNDKQGRPTIEARAGTLYFGVDFSDCNDARTSCDTFMLSGAWNAKDVSLDQVNRWNRWTAFCPAYLDREGAPNMWYTLAVTSHTSREEVAADMDRWIDCLQSFDALVGSPEDFLRRHETPAPPTPAAPAAPAPPHPPGAH